MSQPLIAKIDLHCHSWASDRPVLWLMQRLGCPESYTAPAWVREAALMRGMNFVTITDHNTISGVEEIQHFDNVITGVEVTTYFPGDVKVHVVCLDVTHQQFEEIEAVRADIYNFVRYVNEQHIFHFCAHPLHKVNGRLTWDHFEKLLLLFSCFEILNGTRLRRLNQAVIGILDHLTPEEIDRLSKKHGIEPVGECPWKKSRVGGTDDHSGLFVGSCYTEIKVNSLTKEGVLEGLRRGHTRVFGDSDGILTLSHQVNSIAYQYFSSKIGQNSSELLTVLGRIFERNRPFRIPSRLRLRKGFKKLLKFFWRPKGSKINLIEEIREVVRNSTSFRSLFEEGLMTREEYNAHVFNLSSEVLDQMIIQVADKPQLLHYFIFLAPTVMASYLMVCRNLHSERDLIEIAEHQLGIVRKPKVAWFTDSYVNMDGVSKTCRMFLGAAHSREHDLTMITCHKNVTPSEKGVVNFEPVRDFPTPGYDKVSLYIPSILKVLRYVEQQDFDSIVVSTPGPVGLIGLLCAKLMQLPVYGIYHTDLPRIALQVSSDPMFGELALVITRMFYNRVDRVLCPSQWYVEDVQNLGIPGERTDIMERWIDTRLFSPDHLEESYWEDHLECNLLYVGRISKDKNLDLLVRVYEALAPRHKNFVLHCVGDGPYLEELRRRVSSFDRFILTGAKFHKDLATAYASSDVFVYPGLLDTFGNVVVEAQASGLPCVVMNEGGPQELILPGETGFVARTEAEFIQSVEQLLLNPSRRQEMGRHAAGYAAHRFAEETIFTNFWNIVTRPKPNGHSIADFQFNQSHKNGEHVISLKPAASDV